MRRLMVVDSVTSLDSSAESTIVVSGSHAGLYPAIVLSALGVAGAILNDASVGLDQAGIRGLDHLDTCCIPALAVAHESARIGDAADCFARGVVSHLNRAAALCGCAVGQSCADAVECLRQATAIVPTGRNPDQTPTECRHLLSAGPPEVWAVDSASLLRPADIGQVLVTGSHGALLGGRAASAAKADVVAVLFNDAGIGIDRAGVTRLPALDERGIAAATVAAASARIGDGLSTYHDGVLSAVNRLAAELGARVGMPAAQFVDLMISRESKLTP